MRVGDLIPPDPNAYELTFPYDLGIIIRVDEYLDAVHGLVAEEMIDVYIMWRDGSVEMFDGRQVKDWYK